MVLLKLGRYYFCDFSLFSLCLLGTFLVRSGILVSVHAFASDPTRGLYILAYLVVVIGGSLALYAYKGSQIRSRDNAERYSRESMLLLNNILLMTALCVVFLGTLLPLVHKTTWFRLYFYWCTVL